MIGQTVNHITYPGTVWINDVKSMITNVLAKAEKKKITRLNIIDHGNPTGCYIGTDWITVNNFENFSPFLGKLYPAFEKDGFVHLQHCQMGQNKNLMRMFAQIFGVAVYAGTGNEHAGVPYNEGWYVRCSPGARSTTTPCLRVKAIHQRNNVDIFLKLYISQFSELLSGQTLISLSHSILALRHFFGAAFFPRVTIVPSIIIFSGHPKIIHKFPFSFA